MLVDWDGMFNVVWTLWTMALEGLLLYLLHIFGQVCECQVYRPGGRKQEKLLVAVKVISGKIRAAEVEVVGVRVLQMLFNFFLSKLLTTHF